MLFRSDVPIGKGNIVSAVGASIITSAGSVSPPSDTPMLLSSSSDALRIDVSVASYVMSSSLFFRVIADSLERAANVGKKDKSIAIAQRP